MLEELHIPLVLLGGGARRKGPQIASAPRFRIDFSRIEPITSRLEFADHDEAS